ncbi:lysozyme inhibitor LprI family protein [Rhodobacteraceae bacterium DSL-40]|uniref:lysozyme inhibitor LprI family protein n=1 Tax=Amaricoccus sp. B4 TaxID=3368557 RepID=UPI000DAC5FC4
MTAFRLTLPLLLVPLLPAAASADAALECSRGLGSQVEIADCVAAAEATVDETVNAALGFAKEAAQELDGVTGRPVSVPALEASQVAWAAYRDAQCDYIGATYGGGSGSGIAIRSCRVALGRARVAELMASIP